MTTFYGPRPVESASRAFRVRPSDTPGWSSDSSQQPPSTDARYRQAEHNLGLPVSVRSPIKDVSPAENYSYEITTALSKIKPVLEGNQKQVRLKGVTKEFFNLLDTTARSREDLAGWEGARVDLYNGDLIVGYPTNFTHEIMGGIFEQLCENTDSYPPQPPDGSKIITGGTRNIKLIDGSQKSPDYSLYEHRKGHGPRDAKAHACNVFPTIAWEVGYSEGPKKLALDAARMICLSKGLIQLVVTIKITSNTVKKCSAQSGEKRKAEEEPSKLRELESVACAFWEMDFSAFEEAQPPIKKLNELVPDYSHPNQPPTSFTAVVSIESKYYTVRAIQTEHHQLFPDPMAENLNILNRHLYRDPIAEQENKIAFSIPIAQVMKIIRDREEMMESHDLVECSVEPTSDVPLSFLQRKKARLGES